MRTNVLMLMVLAMLLVACGVAPTTSNTASAPGAAKNAPAAASVGAIQIVDPWVRPAAAMTSAKSGDMSKMGGMMGGSNSAAYMTIRNTGTTPDRLTLAQSDVAKAVELHIMVKEGDVMQMRPVENIEVPANGEVELKPGGFHVMFIGLNREIKSEDMVTLKLQFEKAGAVEMKVKARQP